MTGSSYRNVNHPKHTSSDMSHQPPKVSDVYSLADNLEDHTYHEPSIPTKPGLSSSVQQGKNTDKANNYHTVS